MRMQPENFEKIKEIATFNKRSIAMQIEFLIENCISEHEQQYGQIAIESNSNE